MQKIPNPSHRDPVRRLAAATVGTLVALLVVSIPLGHRHVQAAAPAAPDAGIVAPAPSRSDATKGVSDASLPDVVETLRLVPTHRRRAGADVLRLSPRGASRAGSRSRP